MTNGLFFYEKNYKMNEGCEVYVFFVDIFCRLV
jgi:hypothetical protein